MDTSRVSTPGPRSEPAPAQDRHEDRRRALAESALRTLGELGYARSSLREIAQNSEFSHGVVHYYFRDKLDLIVYCARHYQTICVHRYEPVVAESSTAAGLLEAFAAQLAEAVRSDAPMHRLWYDLRAQSLFEPSLRDAVAGVERTLETTMWGVLARFSELSGRPLAVTPAAAYAFLDGLFQQALLGHLCGQHQSLDQFVRQVQDLLPRLLEC